MSEIVTKSSEKEKLVIISENDGDSDVIKEEVKEEGDENKNSCHRENRLTSIIDQLRCQSKMKEVACACAVSALDML
ncbi:unnamed protein product, partial [Brenthis ino]